MPHKMMLLALVVSLAATPVAGAQTGQIHEPLSKRAGCHRLTGAECNAKRRKIHRLGYRTCNTWTCVKSVKAKRERRERRAAARLRAKMPLYSTFEALAACESTSRWGLASGNGFYGGLQFTLSSWSATGGVGMPQNAPKDEQIYRGHILQRMQGWGAWPRCSRNLGLM